MNASLLTQGQVPTGRGSIGYAEYGALDGRPVFLCHGTPGSRFLRHPDARIAVELGVRVIVAERPGMGRSDCRPDYTLLAWPSDLAALADGLGIDRFAVLGYSGGGPFAAACGYALPQRITAIGLVSSVGPADAPEALLGMLASNRMGYIVGRRMPWPLWRFIFHLYYRDAGRHPEMLVRMSPEEPDADREILAAPGVRDVLVETFGAAFQQGTSGVARDGWLLARPWGFRLEDVAVPAFLWQGDADVVVTPAMGHAISGRLRNCAAHFLPGAGHLILFSHWREILETLSAKL